MRLHVGGVDKVKYFDNESIFHLDHLPEKVLFIGGGPIGIEISQALQRLGSKVALIQKNASVLEHDHLVVTKILLQQLEKE